MAGSAHPFQDATVGSLLDRVAAHHPDREPVVLDEERLTFAKFREWETDHREQALAELGGGGR